MLRNTMRRVRLDELCVTRNRHAATDGANRRRSHLRARRHLTPLERTSAAAGANSAVRSSTFATSAGQGSCVAIAPASGGFNAPGPKREGRSGFLEAVADAVKRLDHVEAVVCHLELLAQTFDVAVDGAVVDIDLIVIGRVHQRIAAFHDAGPARE